MTERLPSLFIGSSTEGLDIAREVQLRLQGDAITTIWKDGVFGLGSWPVDKLNFSEET
jgi:CRP/FNR family cyclic AMP-dependent transcriptional regulator